MMTPRHIRIGSLLFVYAAAVLAWVLHVPYRPAYLLRAIPPTAAFVSVHDALDERWLDVAQSSLLWDFLEGRGVTREEIAAVVQDPDLHRWIPRLAAEKTVVAYVPEYGPLRREAWVVATWVGRYSRLMRWYESIGLMDDVRRRRSALGTEIYELVDPLGSGEEAFTFALEDGVLMGCWTAHPGGVSYLQRQARVRDGTPWIDQVELQSSSGPDRGLVYPSRLVGNPVFTRPLFLELSRVETDEFEIAVSGTERLIVNEGASISGEQLDDLSRMLGSLPDAVVGLPTSLVTALLPARDRRIYNIISREAMEQMSGGHHSLPVIAAALSDEYGGRIGRGNAYFLFQGIKVPTFFVALPHQDADQAQASAALMLDRLNGLFQAGLIPRRAEVGDRSMIIVEGTGQDFYSELDIKERVAYAVCDRWVVLCSNSDALRKLIARYDRTESTQFDPDERWRRGASQDGSSLYTWIHVPRVIGSIRAGLTLAKFFVPRDEKGSAARWQIAQALNAVNALSMLDEVELRLQAHEDGWHARLAVEGQASSAP